MLVAMTTLRVPEGAGSKMRVCISDGRLLYTGRMTSSGTAGPRLFTRSYRICAAVSISSCLNARATSSFEPERMQLEAYKPQAESQPEMCHSLHHMQCSCVLKNQPVDDKHPMQQSLYIACPGRWHLCMGQLAPHSLIPGGLSCNDNGILRHQVGRRSAQPDKMRSPHNCTADCSPPRPEPRKESYL